MAEIQCEWIFKDYFCWFDLRPILVEVVEKPPCYQHPILEILKTEWIAIWSLIINNEEISRFQFCYSHFPNQIFLVKVCDLYVNFGQCVTIMICYLKVSHRRVSFYLTLWRGTWKSQWFSVKIKSAKSYSSLAMFAVNVRHPSWRSGDVLDIWWVGREVSPANIQLITPQFLWI